jgi:hypothetical protein
VAPSAARRACVKPRAGILGDTYGMLKLLVSPEDGTIPPAVQR